MSQHGCKSIQKAHEKASLGKIYTVKRQPLRQISYYPKSALIDDYYLDQLTDSHKKNKLSKQKVIKFVGDVDQNIKLVLQNLDSLNECENKIMLSREKALIEKQFRQILQFFYKKISKTRKQRDLYKSSIQNDRKETSFIIQNLQTQLQQLKNQLFYLKKEKQSLSEKLQNEQKKRQFFQRQNMILQQRQHLSAYDYPQNMDFVNKSIQNVDLVSGKSLNIQLNSEYQTENILQTSATNKIQQRTSERLDSNGITHDERYQLEKVLRKHNLQPSQLSEIIQEYLKELKQNYQIQFENAQQKRLYFLAKKMEKIQTNMWNKKVKKDIEKLMKVKS